MDVNVAQTQPARKYPGREIATARTARGCEASPVENARFNGQRVKQLMEAAGLDQQELAKRVGANKSQPTRWFDKEDPSAPRVDVAYRICKLFGIEMDELFGRPRDAASETASLVRRLPPDLQAKVLTVARRYLSAHMADTPEGEEMVDCVMPDGSQARTTRAEAIGAGAKIVEAPVQLVRRGQTKRRSTRRK
jgi:transcriptional regulator with XRE-family HTH domain